MKTVQNPRGITAAEDLLVGPEGQIRVDTSRGELRLHDGVTAGGRRIPNMDAIKTLFGFSVLNNYSAIRRVTSLAELQAVIVPTADVVWLQSPGLDDLFWWGDLGSRGDSVPSASAGHWYRVVDVVSGAGARPIGPVILNGGLFYDSATAVLSVVKRDGTAPTASDPVYVQMDMSREGLVNPAQPRVLKFTSSCAVQLSTFPLASGNLYGVRANRALKLWVLAIPSAANPTQEARLGVVNCSNVGGRVENTIGMTANNYPQILPLWNRANFVAINVGGPAATTSALIIYKDALATNTLGYTPIGYLEFDAGFATQMPGVVPTRLVLVTGNTRLPGMEHPVDNSFGASTFTTSVVIPLDATPPLTAEGAQVATAAAASSYPPSSHFRADVTIQMLRTTIGDSVLALHAVGDASAFAAQALTHAVANQYATGNFSGFFSNPAGSGSTINLRAGPATAGTISMVLAGANLGGLVGLSCLRLYEISA